MALPITRFLEASRSVIIFKMRFVKSQGKLSVNVGYLWSVLTLGETKGSLFAVF